MIRFFLRFLNIIVLGAFMLTASNPFLSLEKWLGAGFLGILFPYVLCLVLILIVLDFVFLPRWAVICLVVLAIFYKQVLVVFAVNISGLGTFQPEKQQGVIRVMTWNVRRFQPLSTNNVYALNLSEEHKQLLTKYQPDILCMQEFITQQPVERVGYDISGYIERNLGYNYSFFSKDYTLPKNLHSGNIIYSKYPIIGGATFKLYSGSSIAAAIPTTMYVDILYQGDTLRVVVVHLESYGLKNREYQDIAKIRAQHGVDFTTYEGLFRKIRNSFMARTYQARTLATLVRSSPYPLILAGDFNDVPLSYTYFAIRKAKAPQLQDAFLSKGFGIGSTYTKLLPMLRIDYILCSNNLEICQTDVIGHEISDHLPVISDLKLKP